MSTRDKAAEVLAAHAYIPSLARGVSHCTCGTPMHGMPHEHWTHAADELAEAGLLRDEQERDTAFTSRDNAERENDRLRTERDKLKVRLVGELQAAVEAEGALARVEALLDEWYCADPEEHTDCKSARLRAALRGDR